MMEPGRLAGCCYISLCEFHLYIYTHKVTSLSCSGCISENSAYWKLRARNKSEISEHLRVVMHQHHHSKSHMDFYNILHRPLDGHFCLLLYSFSIQKRRHFFLWLIKSSCASCFHRVPLWCWGVMKWSFADVMGYSNSSNRDLFQL